MRRTMNRLGYSIIFTALLCVSAALLFTLLQSCGITKDFEAYNGGPVELFQGKPRAVRMAPRQLIGPMPAGRLSAHTQPVKGILVADTGCDFKGDLNPLTYLQDMLGYYATGISGDLPFHYFLDPQGNCYTGRTILSPPEIHQGDPFTLRCESATPLEIAQARVDRKRAPMYNLDGYLLICVIGDYDNQLVEKNLEKQLLQLLAYLCDKHTIPSENIYALRALHPETNNPGFYLNNYLQASILERYLPPVRPTHRFMQPQYKPGG